MNASVILTPDLRKDYGKTHALVDLDLQVGRGEVFGFLGPNGAGKTTTIRILLDLIRATGGTARVFGLDTRRDSVALRRRLGYLPGDLVLDVRQTGHELLAHLAHLRGGVPTARIGQLAERLELDLRSPIRSLSKGNRQKVGLVQAFMHEPELLVLDEPTSGLDPFLQAEFTAMAREVAASGRTVFMSSHVMSEVQKVADRVGIIREGVLAAVEGVGRLLESAAREVEIVFADPVDPLPFQRLDGVTEVRVDGPVLRCRLQGPADALIKQAAGHTVLSLTSEEPDLEDIFFRRYSAGALAAANGQTPSLGEGQGETDADGAEAAE
jgi:beta-exotoxin I transport system ATP-binding protein